MKKLLVASIGLLVMSSAAFAGGTGVSNDLKVMKVNTHNSVSVDRDTRGTEHNVGTAYSVKTDKITENIALPDGVGTKSVVTDIYASSSSTGTIEKSFTEELNLNENTDSKGFSQYVGAGATYE